MSNAQVLYLQHLVNKKLCQDEESPRKLVAHQNLWHRLQPLVAEADNEISGSQGALCKAIEETASWLSRGNQGKMRDFEQEISMRRNTERLACLNLTGGSARADRPQWRGKRDFCAEIELVEISAYHSANSYKLVHVETSNWIPPSRPWNILLSTVRLI